MSNSNYIKLKDQIEDDFNEPDECTKACFAFLSGKTKVSVSFQVDHDWFIKGTNPDYWLWKMNLEDKFNIQTEDGYWVFEDNPPSLIHLAGMLARVPMESCELYGIKRNFKSTLEKWGYDPLKCVLDWAYLKGKEFGYESSSHGVQGLSRKNIQPEQVCIKKAIQDCYKTSLWINDSYVSYPKNKKNCIGLVS